MVGWPTRPYSSASFRLQRDCPVGIAERAANPAPINPPSTGPIGFSPAPAAIRLPTTIPGLAPGIAPVLIPEFAEQAVRKSAPAAIADTLHMILLRLSVLPVAEPDSP
jgi:hypothetical protein